MSLPDQPPKHNKAAYTHDEGGKKNAPDHYPVENRLPGTSRRIREFIAFRFLGGQCDILNAVGYKIQPKKLDRQQWHWQAKRDRQKKEDDFRRARRDEHEDDLADIGVGYSTFPNAGDDRGEIVVGNDDVRAF